MVGGRDNLVETSWLIYQNSFGTSDYIASGKKINQSFMKEINVGINLNESHSNLIRLTKLQVK